MSVLLADLLLESARSTPAAPAIKAGKQTLPYETLAQQVTAFSGALLGTAGAARAMRVGVWLDKRAETVAALFGAAHAGCVLVPINPLLKAEQAAYIAADCDIQVLVTTRQRAAGLGALGAGQAALRHLIVVDGDAGEAASLTVPGAARIWHWSDFVASGRAGASPHRIIDVDMAAILYTSGSTGKPKGVVLSHRNMVEGARSVAAYLGNTREDRLLAVLPLSFDYGLSQLTTAFLVGASTVLHNYLLPQDVIRALVRERITGLAAVPPLWLQLAALDWPAEIDQTLRYFTNSGGAMPTATLTELRKRVPSARPYLMYGLTEAFRSTYLPPEEVDRRPTSMGKAIPNAEILVVREDGSECAADEPGELVHRGALVAMGYWNDPAKTAERFKPLPDQDPALPITEMAVWSGDTVRKDGDGFLYFVSRRDEMIKTSGYRVSPTEIEEVVYRTGRVAEVAAFGVDHPALGQAIVLVACPADGCEADTQALLDACKTHLPAYMIPHRVDWQAGALPRNANGKIDRKLLSTERACL